MVTRAPSLKLIAIAVGFALSCIGLIIFTWVEFGGSVPLAARGYQFSAVFNETGLLVPNEDVRIAGVNVGKVVSLSPRGTQSVVTMSINSQFAPIPRDTRAILREKTLLGEGYVELSTGDGAGPKLADDGLIPNSQVANTQQLDQVLNAFTPPVQHDFQQFLIGTGDALDGQGQNLNDAFGNLDPTATYLNELAGVLNAQSTDVCAMIRNSGVVLTALGERGSDLQTLITQGQSFFTSTADENHNVTSTINALPPFLTQLKTTLVTLNKTLGIAHPSLTAIAPVAPLLRPALADLTSLSTPLISLLHTAPGVLREAERVLPDITSFVHDTTPLANSLLPAAENLVPIVNVVADYRSQLVLGMVDLAAILNAQAPANTTSDALGVPTGQAKYLRQLLTLGPDTLFGQSTRNAAERSNTYFAPGALDSVGTTGEPAASCAGAGSGNVPCTLQAAYPWGHGIPSSYYPHVAASGP